jgi:nickel-dependent lactate racemase
MATFAIPYESLETIGTTLNVSVPDENVWKDFSVKEPPGIVDLVSAVLKAVDNPFDGKKFSDLVGPGKKVVFLTENQFRQAPAEKILSSLVAKARAAGADVSVIIANGKVPALNAEEIRLRVGSEVVDQGIPVTCNDVSDPGRYRFLGVTSAGVPLWILESIADADVSITISTTQATLWGYGGSGMVIPGVAGNETIEMNHIMSLAPDCIPGNNLCKMQTDKYQALEMAKITMGINLIVSNAFEVIYVNAGTPVASHKEAVKEYDKLYRFNVHGIGQADIAIVGTTAPTDHLFFHTGWACVNVSPVVKKGGTIIHASPCPGYGDWPGFALMDLMKEYMPANPENKERALRAFYAKDRELWAGCIWYPVYNAMVDHTLDIVTLEENIAMARDIGLSVATDLQATFDAAIKKHGPGARVVIVPFGRYSVFST